MKRLLILEAESRCAATMEARTPTPGGWSQQKALPLGAECAEIEALPTKSICRARQRVRPGLQARGSRSEG